MSNLTPVDWFIRRRSIRINRRKLKAEQRQYLDRIVAEIFSEAKDETEFKQFFEAKVASDSSRMGFDPTTIMLLIQLAILIYQLLKHFEVIKPTPELVGVMCGDE
jgi:hypothetical protein